MEAIAADLACWMDSSGLLAGRVPSLAHTPTTYWHGEIHAIVCAETGIACVSEPSHAVCLGITKQARAGVSIGRPRGLATIPDLVLGGIDRRGFWHWANDAHGMVVNLHAAAMHVRFPCDVWPVYLTFGSCDADSERATLIRDRAHLDVGEHLRRAAARRFWDLARQEFIAATWAPHRLLTWCLDTDELHDLGILV